MDTAVAKVSVAKVSVAEQEDQFVDLFREYRLKAFHYALQIVGNREDAMDVTQEAFLRLHRHWRKRDPDRPFSAWLYAVVRNLSVDLIRRRTVRKENAIDEVAPMPAPAAGPESAAQTSERSRMLWREIQRLPDVQREALLLRDWHGLSYSAIAEATGTNTTTVNSRLHDARTRLRERLRRYL